MSLLRSNELRVLLEHAGSLTDISGEVRSFSNPGVPTNWSKDGTALFIGFRHRFNHRYIKTRKSGASIGDPASGESSSNLIVSYWNGSSWVAFTDVVDETSGLTESGFVVWEEKDDWCKDKSSNIPALSTYSNNPELYWVKFTLDDGFDSITIQSVKFILSDDRAMVGIFPEIMQYLPNGKQDFLEQHESAKDSITTSLKVKGVISYQEQIKNPDDWLLAATYRAIDIILTPISGDERLLEVKRDIAAKSAYMMNLSKASIDKDKSETLDDEEDPESNSSTSGSTSGWMTR